VASLVAEDATTHEKRHLIHALKNLGCFSLLLANGLVDNGLVENGLVEKRVTVDLTTALVRQEERGAYQDIPRFPLRLSIETV
jgi:hypothetical protein